MKIVSESKLQKNSLQNFGAVLYVVLACASLIMAQMTNSLNLRQLVYNKDIGDHSAE